MQNCNKKKLLIVTNHSYMLYRFRKELIQRLMEDYEVVISTPFVGHEEDLRNLGVRCIETDVERRSVNPFTDLKLFHTYKTILKKALELNKTSHSYLFWGTEGIGKKLIAKEVAKRILCLEKNMQDCKCKSCIEFDSDNNPDFQLIEATDGKIKIDQIREMQRKIAEKPIISSQKVYLIDDADTMTVEAQNCLLKTLEEPPEYITIILILCYKPKTMLILI